MPCYVPSICSGCSQSGTLTLEPGNNVKWVVTLEGIMIFILDRLGEFRTHSSYIRGNIFKKTILPIWIHSVSIVALVTNEIAWFSGRFEVRSATLLCSACSTRYDVTEKEYIQSGWWPGALSGSNYLFSEKLLKFWYHLDHQFQGASTNKFVAVLNQMALEEERVYILSIIAILKIK